MKYIIANWKMNMNTGDIDKWFGNFPKEPQQNVEIIIAPAVVHLPILRTVEKFYAIKLSAQDVSIQNKGAYTGEVGAFQLRDFCPYCIVGHSERKEPEDVVMQKRDICLEYGITPIVCFVQPETAVKYYIDDIILAKEDPENISVNGEYRSEAVNQIKNDFVKLRGLLPSGTKIIYGGSVNRQNADNLFNIADLDGVLVGNASLDPGHFAEIIKAFSK